MKRLLRWARSPWLLIPLSLLLLYTAAGYLLVPYLIERYAPTLAADQIKRQLSLGEVRFDPFRLTLEVKDFSLREQDGEPLLAFTRLFTDLEIESLVNKAVTLAAITLEHPVIHVVLDAEGQLNFARIADELPPDEEPPPPDSQPLPLLIKHAALIDGTIEFIDQSRSKPINETIDAINLDVFDVSTLPDKAGTHQLKAKFADGSSLDWQGTIGLNPIQSAGDYRIQGLKLVTPWGFVREQITLKPPAGQLDVGAKYRFEKKPDTLELELCAIGARVTGLQLVPVNSDEPILLLDRIELKDGEFDLLKQTVNLPSLLIQKGRVWTDVDEHAEMNWQKLAAPEKPPAAKAATPPARKGPAEPPWLLKLGEFKIAEIGLRYTDASRRSPIELNVDRFGLGLSAAIEVGKAEPKVLVEGIGAELKGLELKERAKNSSLVTLDGVSLKQGRLDLAKHEITLDQLALSGGGTAIERDEKGEIRLLEVFAPADQGAIRREISTVKSDAEKEGDPWIVALKQLALQGFRAALADRSLSPKLVYDFEDIDLQLKDLVLDGKTPIAFSANLNIKQGGRFSASGTAAQTGDQVDADIRLDGFDLTGLQAFVADAGALKLQRGDLSTQMRVSFKQAPRGPSVKAQGQVSSSNLLLSETANRKRFLSWKQLTIAGIDFGMAPDKLKIREIHFIEPETNFEIFEDQTTNVAAIFGDKKPKSASKIPPAKRAKDTGKGARRTSTAPFPFAVERVKIDDATVDFSDQSLIFPFKTRIHNFDGTVSGISTTRSGRAMLKLEGQVDQYGEATLQGQLNVMQHTKFSDVMLMFRNVDMSSLSPYSGTFAGRRIKSGKLNLDLVYHVEQSKLKSKGKVVLENLTLGKQVESPKAKSLPLDLAVALLTDSEGKITVSLPIEGDVDDPNFVYGGVLWDAIVTVITKVVTAPFTALASVLGGDDETISEILFAPGRASLPPPEREKLKNIAEALAARPRLILKIQGGYDPGLDAEALRSRSVRTALTARLGIRVMPGEDPGPVAVNTARTQKALEELASERSRSGALQQALAAFQKSAARAPKRIGAFSSWLDRASEDTDFYQLLFERLVATAPLRPEALNDLAKQRGRTIVQELTARGSLGRNRVRLNREPDQVLGKEGRIPAQLDLGAGD